MNRKYILFLGVLVLLTSCQLSRFVFYNFAGIKDYKIFESRELRAGAPVFYFPKAETGKYPKTLKVSNKKEPVPFEKFLEDSKTVAFIIIKNDTIQYETYQNNYDRQDVTTSFSMAKSILSMLVGCAIDEGLIKSVDEPVVNYVPELKNKGLDLVTIDHLLQMTSGIKFNESYVNPFGDAASFYYGRNLRKQLANMKPKELPGKTFEYKSGDPQLLGLVLERALKDKTITQYLQEKLWTPLGMEYDASWSIDAKENGLEKAFCCINARAIDFAKFGRLYLNKGNWNGTQLVSRSWVDQSTKIDSSNGGAWYYQNQWWIPTQNGDFLMQGILGQYVYVNPEKNLIIVRVGKKTGGVNWLELFKNFARNY